MQHANVEELVKHEIDEFGPSVEDIVYPEEPVDIPGVVECSQSTNTYNDKPTGGTGDQNIYQELVHKPKNSRQRTGRASAHQQKVSVINPYRIYIHSKCRILHFIFLFACPIE